jgi:hypothetical protein
MNICGFGSVVMVSHEAVVPSVVRYFPELFVCEGRASTVAQDVIVPSVVRYLPA